MRQTAGRRARIIYEYEHQTSEPDACGSLSSPGGTLQNSFSRATDPPWVARLTRPRGAEFRKVPPGNELLCLERIFMKNAR
jgi:hypothetical protein